MAWYFTSTSYKR